MDFSRRKLPKEMIVKLYRMRIESVVPFALMLAPVYIYMRVNEKFVSVKGPLDFFNEVELGRLSQFKYFYLSEFITTAIPYRDAGQRVRELLQIKCVDLKAESDSSQYPEVTLHPTPFELSDEVLKIIGTFWWDYRDGIGVDPFLITVFVNELCELFPRKLLVDSREKNIEDYDLALYRSSWVVFLALMLGYCDLDFLNKLRLKIFEDNVIQNITLAPHTEIDEVIASAYASLRSSRLRVIKLDPFKTSTEKVALKIISRMERVRRDYMGKGTPPTIYGKRGFIDV